MKKKEVKQEINKTDEVMKKVSKDDKRIEKFTEEV